MTTENLKAPSTSNKANMVEIYTTPNCAYCRMAKDYFKKNAVSYSEYDVSKDIPRQREMLEKTHQFGVPVIVINGQIVLGFDRAKINRLLGL